MTTKPYPYQIEGVKRIEHFKGRALVADEMGLGKSLEALLYLHRNDLFPAVVICPASVKYNWPREAAMHFGMTSEVLEGRKPHRRRGEPKQITICNIDILPDQLKYLLSLKPKLIIIDEVQSIKTRSTRRNKKVRASSFRKLCKGRKHILGLSGSPIMNNPQELWQFLSIIRRDLFPAFIPFANQYCVAEWTPYGKKYGHGKNLPELRKLLLSTCMIRRRKKDVLKDLPPKTRILVPLEIKRKEYDSAEQDFLKWLRSQKGDFKKWRSSVRERAFLQYGYLKRLVADLKLPAIHEWLDTFLEDSEGKLIVFGIHKKIIRPLHERYKDLSIRIDGEVTGKRRQAAMDQFQTRKRTRIAFCNIVAGGIGWNGTAASTVAHIELHDNPQMHVQAEDRAHRIGQTDPVHSYYLVARKTIEERVCKRLHRKQNDVATVLDGEDGDYLSIFGQTLRELTRMQK